MAIMRMKQRAMGVAFCRFLMAVMITTTTITATAAFTLSSPPPLTTTSKLTSTTAGTRTRTKTRSSRLFMAKKSKPVRLQDNVEGPLYVNDHCINCAACAQFAPDNFQRFEPHDQYHVVHKQPETAAEFDQARAALAACPVAAIRLETVAEKRHAFSSSALAKQAVEEAWTARDEWIVQQMTLKRRRNEDTPSTSTTTTSQKPFPRPFLYHPPTEKQDPHEASPPPLPDVWWLGHHNEHSFGATPYLLRIPFLSSSSATTEDKPIYIMIDTPRYSPSAVQAVLDVMRKDQQYKHDDEKDLLAPDFLFLTHVDDTADHEQWKQRYPQLQRIFHANDAFEHNWLRDTSLQQVEILLPPKQQQQSYDDNTFASYRLTGEPLLMHLQDKQQPQWTTVEGDIVDDPVIVMHTPGHSPGSLTLYRRPDKNDSTIPGILFTGDTYGYTTRDGGAMTAFPRYGNNLRQQASTLRKFLHLDWQVIAPGHGHARDYRRHDKEHFEQHLEQKKAIRKQQAEEMKVAIERMGIYNYN